MRNIKPILDYLVKSESQDASEYGKIVARIEKKTGVLVDTSNLRLTQTAGFYGGYLEVTGTVTGENGAFHVTIKEVAGYDKVKTHHRIKIEAI